MLLENAKIFVNCMWITNEKECVVVHYKESEDSLILTEIIPINIEDPDWQKVLEHFTLDQIQENTAEQNKRDRIAWLRDVRAMAEQEGLVYDPHGGTKNGYRPAITMFNVPELEDDQEWLFDLKLAVFDLDVVSESTNNELKKKLREAATPLETMYIAGKFLYE